MRVTKREFFKLIGWAGGASVGAAAIADPKVIKPEVIKPVQAEPLYPGRQLHVAATFDPAYYDVVDGKLYDSVSLRAGTVLPEHLQLFCTPMGQMCPYSRDVKTTGRTNVHQAGMLPPPSQFLVRRVQVMVAPEIHPDDLRVVRRMAWEFQVINKTYGRGPLLMDARPWRLADYLGGGKTKPEAAMATRATHEFKECNGILIPSLAYYSMTVRGAHGPYRLKEDLDLAVAFEGLDFRAVQ